MRSSRSSSPTAPLKTHASPFLTLIWIGAPVVTVLELVTVLGPFVHTNDTNALGLETGLLWAVAAIGVASGVTLVALASSSSRWSGHPLSVVLASATGFALLITGVVGLTLPALTSLAAVAAGATGLGYIESRHALDWLRGRASRVLMVFLILLVDHGATVVTFNSPGMAPVVPTVLFALYFVILFVLAFVGSAWGVGRGVAT